MNKLVTLVAFASLAACSSVTPPAGTTAEGSSAATAEAPPDLTGTWDFALDRSDVASRYRDACAREQGAGADACFAEVRAQAAKEKIRFANDDAGRTIWTSFETDGEHETVYVSVPVALARDGAGHVLARIAGVPSGEETGAFSKAKVDVMRIELVDARTIAMVDPKKGRLVYTKQ